MYEYTINVPCASSTWQTNPPSRKMATIKLSRLVTAAYFAMLSIMLVFLTCEACDVTCSELLRRSATIIIRSHVLITGVTAECLSECLSGKTSIRSDFNRFMKLLNNGLRLVKIMKLKFIYMCAYCTCLALSFISSYATQGEFINKSD